MGENANFLIKNGVGFEKVRVVNLQKNAALRTEKRTRQSWPCTFYDNVSAMVGTHAVDRSPSTFRKMSCSGSPSGCVWRSSHERAASELQADEDGEAAMPKDSAEMERLQKRLQK